MKKWTACILLGSFVLIITHMISCFKLISALWWKMKGFCFHLPPQSRDVPTVGCKHQVYHWLVLMDKKETWLYDSGHWKCFCRAFTSRGFNVLKSKLQPQHWTYRIIIWSSSGVVFLCEVSQVVIIVEVEVRHQLLLKQKLIKRKY